MVKWQVFPETLDLAEEEEIHNFTLVEKETTEERLWSVHIINQSGGERGGYVMVNHIREVDKEQHFQCFRMSKYRFDDLLHQITPYIQHQNTQSNPIGVLRRPAVVQRIIWVITTV